MRISIDVEGLIPPRQCVLSEVKGNRIFCRVLLPTAHSVKQLGE